MPNMIDYIDWRGDLAIGQDPFNEVDNLILSEFCFLDLEGIVPAVETGKLVPLGEAVEAYFRRHQGQKLRMGVLVPDQILTMAARMAESPRFASMGLGGFCSHIDSRREAQFAALTVDIGNGGVYLAFRGTDDTLVGWKEDFNMAFLSTVPSQPMAVEYVKAAAAAHPGKKLTIGGHSKGGNLAVYSAVHCGGRLRRRIRAVYNNDGPGFKESLVETEAYQALRERIHTIVPRSSIVGMLLEHDDNYDVVASCEKGIYQHDGFSWEVLGSRFVRLRDISPAGRTSDRTIRDFIGAMDDARRERFVDALFEVLGSTNARTLTDLSSDRMGAVTAMIRRYKDFDKETRQTLLEAVGVLLKVSAGDWVEDLEERGQELKKLLNVKK